MSKGSVNLSCLLMLPQKTCWLICTSRLISMDLNLYSEEIGSGELEILFVYFFLSKTLDFKGGWAPNASMTHCSEFQLLNLRGKTHKMILELPAPSSAQKELWSCLSHPHTKKAEQSETNQQPLLDASGHWGQRVNWKDRQTERDHHTSWKRKPRG